LRWHIVWSPAAQLLTWTHTPATINYSPYTTTIYLSIIIDSLYVHLYDLCILCYSVECVVWLVSYQGPVLQSIYQRSPNLASFWPKFLLNFSWFVSKICPRMFRGEQFWIKFFLGKSLRTKKFVSCFVEWATVSQILQFYDCFSNTPILWQFHRAFFAKDIELMMQSLIFIWSGSCRLLITIRGDGNEIAMKILSGNNLPPKVGSILLMAVRK